ncbi:MAG: Ig-like domain-containing protein [Caldilineaceae bacterium]
MVTITGTDVATARQSLRLLGAGGRNEVTSSTGRRNRWPVDIRFDAADQASVVHTVQSPATTTAFNWLHPGPKLLTVTVTTTNQVFSATHPLLVHADIPARLSMTIGEASFHEDGSRTYPLTAVVEDHVGNALPDVLVRFGTTTGEISVSSPTDSAGVALAELTVETQYGTVTVTADAGTARASREIFLGTAPVEQRESRSSCRSSALSGGDTEGVTTNVGNANNFAWRRSFLSASPDCRSCGYQPQGVGFESRVLAPGHAAPSRATTMTYPSRNNLPRPKPLFAVSRSTLSAW